LLSGGGCVRVRWIGAHERVPELSRSAEFPAWERANFEQCVQEQGSMEVPALIAAEDMDRRALFHAPRALSHDEIGKVVAALKQKNA